MRAFLALLALALPAAALTVDEVVQLTEAGVSDDIILEQLKADGSVFELSARQIVDLQKKKVSPQVIRAMIAARGKEVPAKKDGKPAPIPTADLPKGGEEEKDASLTVRNVGKGIVSVIVYAREREIALVQGEISTAVVLLNGSRSEIKMPSGLYRVRWSNEEPFREVAVAKNVTTELEFRDDARAWRGIRVAAIVDGKEEADPNAKVETPAEEAVQPRVYQSPTNSSVTVFRDWPQPASTRVVIVPGTSTYERVYYPDRAYADDYGTTSYYADPYYRPAVTFRVGYGSSCYRSYGYNSCAPIYYHGGHSWDSCGNHHYSRVADNIQYYLNWPFGHRHR